jgi:REP-associated tyrosine transposase
MPRVQRSTLPPGFFHVINRSTRKAPLFQKSRDYRAFLGTLKEGLVHHPVNLLAYCVMSTHWHLVLGPVVPIELSQLMHWVTLTHAIRWHRHRRTVGQGPVYQGRFKSEAIVAAARLVHACRYVERNALRAGLVKRAQDWPWSSLSERLSPAVGIPLVSTPFLASPMWVDYVNAPLALDERLQRPDPVQVVSVENRPDPLHDLADRPGRLAGRPQAIDEKRAVVAIAH